MHKLASSKSTHLSFYQSLNIFPSGWEEERGAVEYKVVSDDYYNVENMKLWCHDDSPVHRYGHRDGAVHGGDQLVVGGLQQADVVHTIHSAAIVKDCKVGH